MIDIETRLKKTLSAMAGNEALSDSLEEEAAAEIFKWGQELAEYFVRQTGAMEDEEAEAFLVPRLAAVRKLLRAVGGWAAESDAAIRQEWWTRIEQTGRSLYGEKFSLPPINTVLGGFPGDAGHRQVISQLRNLIDTRR